MFVIVGCAFDYCSLRLRLLPDPVLIVTSVEVWLGWDRLG